CPAAPRICFYTDPVHSGWPTGAVRGDTAAWIGFHPTEFAHAAEIPDRDHARGSGFARLQQCWIAVYFSGQRGAAHQPDAVTRKCRPQSPGRLEPALSAK